MAKNDPIPASDHVTRWIKPKFAPREEDGTLIEIFPQAYELKDGEEYLSVTWLEHFGGDRQSQREAAAEAVRQSFDKKKLQASSTFTVANVGRLAEACLARGSKVRILHEPEDENTGHVAVRRFPREAGELLEILAGQVFIDPMPYADLKPAD